MTSGLARERSLEYYRSREAYQSCTDNDLLQCETARWHIRVLRIEMQDEPRWTKTHAHVCAGVFARSGLQRILLVDTDGKEVSVESIAP